MLEPYAARLSGFQGYHAFPHTVMGVAHQGPGSLGRRPQRLEKIAAGYQLWLEQTEASLPLGEKLRRRASQLYRSKGERRQIASLLRGRVRDRRRHGRTGRSAAGIRVIPAMAAC